MRDDLIPKFVHALGSKLGNKTDKVWIAECPMAPWTHQSGRDQNPSFAVFRGPGATGNCFSCSAPGNLGALVLDIRRRNKLNPSGKVYDFGGALEILDAQAKDEPLILDDGVPSYDELAALPPKSSVAVWPESFLDKFEDAYTETQVHPYLASRAINCTTARRLDLKWDAKLGRVCFPLRDYHTRLCGLHGRAVSEDTQPKYWFYPWQGHTNPQVWTGEHWLDFEKTAVVTESVFDLARVYPIWPNVITPRMAGLSDAQLKRLDGLTHIVTLFDSDKAGDEARKIMSTLKGCTVEHASVYPYKDAGEATEEMLRARLSQFFDLNAFSIAMSE